jgi:hypothetical protein
MIAPPAPSLGGFPQAPDTQAPGTALTITLGGQYDNAVVVVVNDQGDITYDSRPTTAGEYVDWVKNDTAMIDVVVPGTAFTTPNALYIVGVAGIRKALDSSFENFNPLVSNLAMGSVAAQGIITGN